ncbi:MAG: hypothetical protein U0350_29660 [Caldilineaceae bacterium]
MALLTVEIPETLLSKLKRTGRPAQEVIVEALEQTLNGVLVEEESTKPTRREVVQHLIESGAVRDPDAYKQALQKKRQHIKQKLELQDMPREEVVRRLLEAGLIREPGSWDNEYARVWRELSEEEKQRHIKEMNEMFFSDSPASRFIIENHR